MSPIRTIYTDDFFEHFLVSFDPHRQGFDSILPHALWWMLDLPGRDTLIKEQRRITHRCGFLKRGKSHKESCRRAMRRHIRLAQESKKPVSFTCPYRLPACIIPVGDTETTTGCLCVCHIKTVLTRELVDLLQTTASTVQELVLKRQEVIELQETIRPRAIALSTIHTVHRLTSMSLGITDLLSRIARLCLQVLNIHYCDIRLIEKKGVNWLVPHAWVGTGDVDQPKRRKVGTGLQGEVAVEGIAAVKDDIVVVPLIDEDVIGVLTVMHKKNGKPFGTLDREIAMTLSEQCVVAMKNVQLYEDLEHLTLGTIKSMHALLDTRTRDEYAHTPAFSDLVVALAEEMRLPHTCIRNLHYAALLPDAGKLVIPEAILTKQGALTGEELKIIKQHPAKGAKIIAPLRALEGVMPIILYHHEKYDGTGYPEGLKGDAIPLEARIMAVADAFEAMLRDKPYRKTIALSKAVQEIKRNSGKQFDPKVVRVFLKIVRDGKTRSFLSGLRRANGQKLKNK